MADRKLDFLILSRVFPVLEVEGWRAQSDFSLFIECAIDYVINESAGMLLVVHFSLSVKGRKRGVAVHVHVALRAV